MARSIGEIAKCPDILDVARLFNSVSTSGQRLTRRFDIKLGESEVIDLIAFKVDVELASGTPAASDFTQLAVALSYIDLQETTTTQTREVRAERDDIITEFTFASDRVITSGSQHTDRYRIIYYNPPKCLVRAPSLDIGMITNNNNAMVDYVFAEVYYIKKGVVRSVLSQLMKVYSDARAIYRELRS